MCTLYFNDLCRIARLGHPAVLDQQHHGEFVLGISALAPGPFGNAANADVAALRK
jgi:hypothetical protein